MFLPHPNSLHVPTDIYISGYEIGAAILFPAASIENDFPAGNRSRRLPAVR